MNIDSMKEILGGQTEALEQELRLLQVASREALEPLGANAFGALVFASEKMGGLGDFLAHHKALIPLLNVVLVVSTGLAACGVQGRETPAPTLEPTKIVEPTIEVKPTSTAVNISTEVPPGSGGLETEAMRAFKESPRGKEQEGAFREYVKYWEKFGLFAPRAEIWLTPLAEAGNPNDPNLMLYVAEVNDPNFEGMVFTIPYAQIQKYVETGDADYLVPPQDADYLLKGTDPFKMSKQVREGSVPASVGIPVGSILKNVDQDFVYMNADGMIVGELNEKAQWEKSELMKPVEGVEKVKLDERWLKIFVDYNLAIKSDYFVKNGITAENYKDKIKTDENGNMYFPALEGSTLSFFRGNQWYFVIGEDNISTDLPFRLNLHPRYIDPDSAKSILNGLASPLLAGKNSKVTGVGWIVKEVDGMNEMQLVIVSKDPQFDLDGNKWPDGKVDQAKLAEQAEFLAEMAILQVESQIHPENNELIKNDPDYIAKMWKQRTGNSGLVDNAGLYDFNQKLRDDVEKLKDDEKSPDNLKPPQVFQINQ